MNITTDSLVEAIREVVSYCGYGKDTEIECWVAAGASSYEFGVYTRHSIHMQLTMLGNESIANEMIKQVRDPIQNSDLVKYLTDDLTTQVQKLTDKVKEQTLDIELLNRYKIYYDLHYKMEHGK